MSKTELTRFLKQTHDQCYIQPTLVLFLEEVSLSPSIY